MFFGRLFSYGKSGKGDVFWCWCLCLFPFWGLGQVEPFGLLWVGCDFPYKTSVFFETFETTQMAFKPPLKRLPNCLQLGFSVLLFDSHFHDCADLIEPQHSHRSTIDYRELQIIISKATQHVSPFKSTKRNKDTNTQTWTYIHKEQS